jgi:hypothetical protein
MHSWQHRTVQSRNLRASQIDFVMLLLMQLPSMAMADRRDGKRQRNVLLCETRLGARWLPWVRFNLRITALERSSALYLLACACTPG